MTEQAATEAPADTAATEAPAAEGHAEAAAATAPTGPTTAAGTLAADLPTWVTDPGLRTLAGAKGWKDADAAVKSYSELEKLFGADKAGKTVVLPDADDADGRAAIYDRMGRPETPEAYGLADRDGADPGFAASMSQALYNAGVSADKVGGLADAYQAFTDATNEQGDAAFMQQSEADMAEFTRLNGPRAGEMLNAYKAAARTFGFTPEEIGSIERSIGTKATLDRFAAIGMAMTEDTLPGAAAAVPAADARTAIGELKGDKEFRKSLRDGDPEAKAKWDGLHVLLKEQTPRPPKYM